MRKVKLSNSKKFALVDDEDYVRVSKYTWKLEHRKYIDGYARAYVNGKTERLHRFILRINGRRSRRVDHRDRSGLNNQKSNLRFATSGQNRANAKKRYDAFTSRYKGVYRRGNKWRAVIDRNGKHVHLGFYNTEHLAAAAYDGAAIILFGEYARLNLP